MDAPNPLWTGGSCPSICGFAICSCRTRWLPRHCPIRATRHSSCPSRSISSCTRGRCIDWRHGGTTPGGRPSTARLPNSLRSGRSTPRELYASPGAPFQGNTSTGGRLVHGGSISRAYKNTYFHADYGAQWIRNFVLDANDFPVEVRHVRQQRGRRRRLRAASRRWLALLHRVGHFRSQDHLRRHGQSLRRSPWPARTSLSDRAL